MAPIKQKGFAYKTALEGTKCDVTDVCETLPEKLATDSKVVVRNLPPLPIPAAVNDFLDVIIAFVESPERVFVQLKNEESTIEQISSKLKEEYANGTTTPVLVNPFRGQLCIAKYISDGQWYRASIVERPDPSRVTVFFVDYGNMETIDKRDIRPMSEAFLDRPPQAIAIKLSGLLNDGVDASVKQYMDTLLDQQVTVKLEGNAGNCFEATMMMPVNDEYLNVVDMIKRRVPLTGAAQAPSVNAPALASNAPAFGSTLPPGDGTAAAPAPKRDWNDRDRNVNSRMRTDRTSGVRERQDGGSGGGGGWGGNSAGGNAGSGFGTSGSGGFGAKPEGGFGATRSGGFGSRPDGGFRSNTGGGFGSHSNSTAGNSFGGGGGSGANFASSTDSGFGGGGFGGGNIDRQRGRDNRTGGFRGRAESTQRGRGGDVRSGGYGGSRRNNGFGGGFDAPADGNGFQSGFGTSTDGTGGQSGFGATTNGNGLNPSDEWSTSVAAPANSSGLNPADEWSSSVAVPANSNGLNPSDEWSASVAAPADGSGSNPTNEWSASDAAPVDSKADSADGGKVASATEAASVDPDAAEWGSVSSTVHSTAHDAPATSNPVQPDSCASGNVSNPTDKWSTSDSAPIDSKAEGGKVASATEAASVDPDAAEWGSVSSTVHSTNHDAPATSNPVQPDSSASGNVSNPADEWSNSAAAPVDNKVDGGKAVSVSETAASVDPDAAEWGSVSSTTHSTTHDAPATSNPVQPNSTDEWSASVATPVDNKTEGGKVAAVDPDAAEWGSVSSTTHSATHDAPVTSNPTDEWSTSAAAPVDNKAEGGKVASINETASVDPDAAEWGSVSSTTQSAIHDAPATSNSVQPDSSASGNVSNPADEWSTSDSAPVDSKVVSSSETASVDPDAAEWRSVDNTTTSTTFDAPVTSNSVQPDSVNVDSTTVASSTVVSETNGTTIANEAVSADSTPDLESPSTHDKPDSVDTNEACAKDF
uniref:Tudor domain-containing protein n=1 Tax=Plectus sambesii TaxID=2011161 RepID=A0A914WNV9_9BILA